MKKIVPLLLVIPVVALVGVPGALAIPDYYGVLQSIYSGPTTCQLDCHTSENGPPPFTTYGTAFSAQPNHADVTRGGTKAALIAIGPPLATITITPTTVSLPVGGIQTFTAATLDSFGNNITTNVTWISSNTAVGTIDSITGIFTAVGAGTTTITATGGGTGSGNVTGNATVAVAAPTVVPVLKTITVSPSTASLNVNGTQDFTATALDQNNTPMAGTNISWTVSNSTVGNVSPLNAVTSTNGTATTMFTALAVGNAMVNATNGTVSGSANVTVTAQPVTAPPHNLTLTLNNTMDGTSPPLVSNFTGAVAVLLDTSGNTVAKATFPDNMTAQFNLSGISPGDYFIEINGLAGDHLPTRIDSNASDINQSVGLRLRNSVIGNISNPTYRIKVYPSGSPPVVNSSHPVVNYITGANETKYNFVIVPGNTSKIEIHVLNTSAELSNFTPSSDTHPAGANFPSEPFQIWILGDVTNSTGAFIGNHGHLFNSTADTCSVCHGNVSVKLPNYSDITPPFVSTPAGGWCFKCHYGPGGPRNGFVDPIAVVAANGTIAGNVTNASSGSAISGATLTANGMMATTDANGSYSISIAAGTYTITASATGFQTNTTTGVIVTPGNVTTQDFALTPTAVSPPQATFNISGFKINDTNGNGVWDSGEMGIENWNINLLNATTGTQIANTSTDASGFYQFTNLTNGSYNVTENVTAGWTPTNATFQNITIAGQDIMNLNFTNMPVAPSVAVITSFVLKPDTTTALKGMPITISITALNGSMPQTLFNGTANITITANNMSTVSSPANVSFTNGNATVQVTSSVAQFVTVTATNNSINGSTQVMFADKVFSLNKGWNLISIPNFANMSNISQALMFVQNNGVVGFDPATDNFTTPTNLEPLFGYWINVTADNQSLGFIASTNIPSVPPTRRLYEGWNLIGVSASKNDPDTLGVGELFEDLKFGSDHTQWLYSRLVSFEQPTSPVTLVAGKDLFDFTSLKQGHGYWLFIKNIPNTNMNNVPWAGKQW